MPITAHDIATIVRDDHDLSAAEAAEAVGNCIATLEGINGEKINPNDIDRLDAGFIEIMIAVEQHQREVAAANPDTF